MAIRARHETQTHGVTRSSSIHVDLDNSRAGRRDTFTIGGSNPPSLAITSIAPNTGFIGGGPTASAAAGAQQVVPFNAYTHGPFAILPAPGHGDPDPFNGLRLISQPAGTDSGLGYESRTAVIGGGPIGGYESLNLESGSVPVSGSGANQAAVTAGGPAMAGHDPSHHASAASAGHDPSHHMGMGMGTGMGTGTPAAGGTPGTTISVGGGGPASAAAGSVGGVSDGAQSFVISPHPIQGSGLEFLLQPTEAAAPTSATAGGVVSVPGQNVASPTLTWQVSTPGQPIPNLPATVPAAAGGGAAAAPAAPAPATPPARVKTGRKAGPPGRPPATGLGKFANEKKGTKFKPIKSDFVGDNKYEMRWNFTDTKGKKRVLVLTYSFENGHWKRTAKKTKAA